MGDFSSNLQGYPSSKDKSGQEEEGENSEDNIVMGNVGDGGN